MVQIQHVAATPFTTEACTTETRTAAPGGLSPRRENLVKQLILERLGETLEISELARACSLSRSHFSRAFKCSTGLSPQDWIRQQRITRAKQLIRETDLSLTQISLECGFCDQAYFCHIFTRSEGINPFAWRSQQLAARCTRRGERHLCYVEPPCAQ